MNMKIELLSKNRIRILFQDNIQSNYMREKIILSEDILSYKILHRTHKILVQILMENLSISV